MGEFARPPGAPHFASTPLELLTAKEEEGYSVVDKYVPVATGTLIGTGSVFLRNAINRRPLWSALHQYVLLGAACTYLAKLWNDSRLTARAENDAVLKHYISLHPEDFPPYEKTRYKDVWRNWIPIR